MELNKNESKTCLKSFSQIKTQTTVDLLIIADIIYRVNIRTRRAISARKWFRLIFLKVVLLIVVLKFN